MLTRRVQGLARLEELVRKLTDMLHNRVDANLTAIAKTRLVDLPSDRTLTADEFVALQAKHVRTEAERLSIRWAATGSFHSLPSTEEAAWAGI